MKNRHVVTARPAPSVVTARPSPSVSHSITAAALGREVW